tara:strand:- start:506 stop:1669 length:1164 start_codon:yes stop_codon:yes gene_type:complete
MSQVSDYNIANASGASVRSDLNAVFDAIKTLNSGGSDPSNTSPFMPYVDTADSNNLKIRNSANDGFVIVGSVDSANLGLLPRAGGTMTGQLLADDSAGAGAPAIAFDGDTTTGIFRVGSNTIGFATAGVERVEISDNGLDMSNGLPIRFQDSSGAPFVALKSPASVSNNVTFTLPAADGTNGQFLQTNGSGALSFTTVQGVPTGSVFCMAVATVPSGYKECNGEAVSRTTFAALFAVIGTQYGTGDGSSTFNLPDLRGEFVRGFDNGRGVDSGRSINDPQTSANKSHNHPATTSISDPGHFHHSFRSGNAGERQHNSNLSSSNFPSSGTGAGNKNEAYNIVARTGSDPNVGKTSNENTGVNASTTTENDGSSESRPRNIAMMYIIKF